MQVNSIVECIKGHPGVLEEGAYYTVADIRSRGVLLFEVQPPSPYTSFLPERFREVQPPDAIPEILFEVLADTIEN